MKHYLADLNVLVGDEASSREDPMVEIRVAVPCATRVQGLIRRLPRLFDRSSVSFCGAQREIRVRSECESRGVIEVLRAVESWLAEDDPDSAKLSVCNCGELLRPYQLNLAELTCGAVCGVARRSEPNRDHEWEARIPFAGLQRSWQNLSMIDRPFTVVSPVPIASVS